MSLREVPIRRIGTRNNLFLGCDREMILLSGLIAFALIFNAQTLITTCVGLLLWFGSLFLLRQMAKSNPKMRQIYMRHRLYNDYYPPRATPFRINTPKQGKRYA